MCEIRPTDRDACVRALYRTLVSRLVKDHSSVKISQVGNPTHRYILSCGAAGGRNARCTRPSSIPASASASSWSSTACCTTTARRVRSRSPRCSRSSRFGSASPSRSSSSEPTSGHAGVSFLGVCRERAQRSLPSLEAPLESSRLSSELESETFSRAQVQARADELPGHHLQHSAGDSFAPTLVPLARFHHHRRRRLSQSRPQSLGSLLFKNRSLSFSLSLSLSLARAPRERAPTCVL